MLTVKEEYDFVKADKILQQLNIKNEYEYARVFYMLDKDKLIGAYLVALDNNAILLKEHKIISGYGFEHFDLLSRATLNFLSMQTDKIIFSYNDLEYLKKFGFYVNNDRVEIKSQDIVFVGECKK